MNEVTEWNFNHSKQMNEANLIKFAGTRRCPIENLSPKKKRNGKIFWSQFILIIEMKSATLFRGNSEMTIKRIIVFKTHESI